MVKKMSPTQGWLLVNIALTLPTTRLNSRYNPNRISPATTISCDKFKIKYYLPSASELTTELLDGKTAFITITVMAGREQVIQLIPPAINHRDHVIDFHLVVVYRAPTVRAATIERVIQVPAHSLTDLPSSHLLAL